MVIFSWRITIALKEMVVFPSAQQWHSRKLQTSLEALWNRLQTTLAVYYNHLENNYSLAARRHSRKFWTIEKFSFSSSGGG
jgi:hypothetical protein